MNYVARCWISFMMCLSTISWDPPTWIVLKLRHVWGHLSISVSTSSNSNSSWSFTYIKHFISSSTSDTAVMKVITALSLFICASFLDVKSHFIMILVIFHVKLVRKRDEAIDVLSMCLNLIIINFLRVLFLTLTFDFLTGMSWSLTRFWIVVSST